MAKNGEKLPEGAVANTPGTPNEVAAAPVGVADFSFAVNVVKLNRAKAFVNATTPGLKGNELETAVKARYVALGGLVHGEKIARQGKGGGREVNVADHDGSKD